MRNDCKTYVCSYEYEGASWAFEIKASSAEDAKRRLHKMATANIDGELLAKIEIPKFANTLMGKVCKILGITNN